MNTPLRLVRSTLPLLAALALPVAAQDQQPSSASRTDAVQIEAPAAERRSTAGKAYLDTPAPAPAPRPSLMQTAGDQISRPSGNTPTSQISSTGMSGAGVAQLSKADLDATLAQLSAAERQVLLQAIAGTDICDNPPRIPAVIALCQNRLETRSREFATEAEEGISAEERLLRGDVDRTGLPSVGQVIDRLARTSAASDDFSNQAIASIALASPGSSASRPPEEDQGPAGLGEETQALVNAIINQLGGRAP